MVSKVLQAVEALEGKHGRLIPFPALRAALPKMSRTEVDLALFDLRDLGTLILKVSNDRARSDREAGIQMGEQLFFFAARC